MGDRVTYRGAFAPTVPMWAVYYDRVDDSLLTLPVIALAVLGGVDEYGQSFFDIEPYVFGSDYFERPDNSSNYLGLSLTEKVEREAWKDLIEYLVKKEEQALASK